MVPSKMLVMSSQRAPHLTLPPHPALGPTFNPTEFFLVRERYLELTPTGHIRATSINQLVRQWRHLLDDDPLTLLLAPLRLEKILMVATLGM